jgi:flagellin
MRINENMSAVIANKQLLRTESNLAASIERLSSGYKINKPGDNPAGMAISNKMRAQIDALDQAESNVSDAVSVMQIADGALSEVSSVLQRIRELSVQAANDTNSYEDKQSIQAEIDELTKEVNRISTDTEYNQKSLLDGSSDTRVYAEPKSATRIQVSDTVTTGDYKLNIEETAKQATTDLSVDSLFNGDVLNSTYSNTTISLNGVDMTLTDGMTKDSFFEGLRDAAEEAGCKLEWTDDTETAVSVTTTRYGSSAEINMEVSASLAGVLGVNGMTVNEAGNYEASVSGEDAKVSFPTDSDVSGFSSSATVRADGNRITVTDFNGFSIDFLLDSDFNTATASADNGNFKLEVTDIGAMTIQTGGNQYQTMNISIPEVSADTLYLDTVDVTVSGGGDRAIATLDDAMARLSEVRSRIGAFQNRLEYAQTSLAESQEDMTSAYSGLMDTDMATEMVEYTQQNVLEQAATSVLSQANDIPQMVLSMLQ